MKGQGALEYLLLIGGAVLVAAIVLALISGFDESENSELSQEQREQRLREDWESIEICSQRLVTGNLYGVMTCEDVGYGWEAVKPSETELYCVKCVAKQNIECLYTDDTPLCEEKNMLWPTGWENREEWLNWYYGK